MYANIYAFVVEFSEGGGKMGEYGWIITIVILYIPVFYRLNMRINYLENEVRRLKESNKQWSIWESWLMPPHYGLLKNSIYNANEAAAGLIGGRVPLTISEKISL